MPAIIEVCIGWQQAIPIDNVESFADRLKAGQQAVRKLPINQGAEMIDLHKFFQATNPIKTLAIENPDDRKYYIDFSDVRGQNSIQTLRKRITILTRIRFWRWKMSM